MRRRHHRQPTERLRADLERRGRGPGWSYGWRLAALTLGHRPVVVDRDDAERYWPSGTVPPTPLVAVNADGGLEPVTKPWARVGYGPGWEPSPTSPERDPIHRRARRLGLAARHWNHSGADDLCRPDCRCAGLCGRDHCPCRLAALADLTPADLDDAPPIPGRTPR